MTEKETINARIDYAELSIERGILCGLVGFNWEGSHQGFGAIVLGAFADPFISAMCRVAGVDEWSKVPGSYVRITRGVGFSSPITRVTHIVKGSIYFDMEIWRRQVDSIANKDAMREALDVASGREADS